MIAAHCHFFHKHHHNNTTNTVKLIKPIKIKINDMKNKVFNINTPPSPQVSPCPACCQRWLPGGAGEKETNERMKRLGVSTRKLKVEKSPAKR